MDWSALWRYWQLDALNIPKQTISITNLRIKVLPHKEDDEFVDALDWDSMEDLQEAMQELSQEKPAGLGVFEGWFRGLLGQVELKFVGGIRVEGFGGCLSIDSMLIGAVDLDLGERIVLIERAFGSFEGVEALKLNNLTGSMQGNDWKSIQVAADNAQIAYAAHSGTISDIRFGFDGLSVSRGDFNSGSFQELGVDFSPKRLELKAIQIQDSMTESSSANFTIDTIPDIAKHFKVHISSVSKQDWSVAEISGQWPQFTIERIEQKGKMMANGIEVSFSNEPSTADLFSKDQQRFVENISIQLINPRIPQLPISIEIAELTILESTEEEEGSSLKTFQAFHVPVQVHVQRFSLDTRLSAQDCTVSIFDDGKIDARIAEISCAKWNNHTISSGSIRAVFNGQLVLEVDELTAQIDVDELFNLKQEKSTTSLPIEIASVNLKNSCVHLLHSQLPNPFTFQILNIDLLPVLQMAFLDGANLTYPQAMNLQIGCLKAEASVDGKVKLSNDESHFEIVSLDHFQSLTDTLQVLINPPIPLTDPELIVFETGFEGEILEDEFEDKFEDEDKLQSIDFKSTYVDGEVVSLNLNDLKDPMNDVSSAATRNDFKFTFDCKSLTVKLTDFTFSAKNASFASTWPQNLIFSLSTCQLFHQSGPIVVERWQRGPLRESSSTFGSAHDFHAHLSGNDEFQLKLSICPMRLKLSPSVIKSFDHLMQRNLSINQNQNQQQCQQQIFFSHVLIPMVALKVDLPPALHGALFKLPGGHLRGVTGIGGLLAALDRLWVRKLQSGPQLNRVLRTGIVPIRTTIQVSKGLVDLILLPVMSTDASIAQSANQARRGMRRLSSELIGTSALMMNQLGVLLESVLTTNSSAIDDFNSEEASVDWALRKFKRTVVAVAAGEGDALVAVPLAVLQGGSIALTGLGADLSIED